MTLLEQTRKASGFKAYCRRRSTARTKTIAQVFEAACRARRGAIRAYMKPRGINSVLRDQFYDIGDGRTYLIELTAFGFISVMKGDMKFQQEAIFEDNERFAETKALFA